MTHQAASIGLSLRRAVLVTVITGISLGAVNSLSSAFGSAWGPRSLNPGVGGGILLLELVAATLGTTWAYAVVAFLVGWCVRRPVRAAALGILTLLIAVVTYYTSDFLLHVDTQFDAASATLWAIIAFGAGATFGLLGGLGSQGHRWSVLPALAAPAVVVVEQLAGYPTGSDQMQPWPTVVAWVIAGGLLLFVILAAARRAGGGDGIGGGGIRGGGISGDGIGGDDIGGDGRDGDEAAFRPAWTAAENPKR